MDQIRIIAFHPSQIDVVMEKAKTIKEKDHLEIYFILEQALTDRDRKSTQPLPVKEIILDQSDVSVDVESTLHVPHAQYSEGSYSIYIYPYKVIKPYASYIMHQLFAFGHENVELIYHQNQSFHPETELETSHPSQSKLGYKHILKLISSGNYQSAKRIVENWTDIPTEIKHLLQFGYSMYNQELQVKMYNTVDMIALLTEKMQQFGYPQDHITYIENFRQLQQFDQLTFIYYLHNYLEVLYQNNDLIDFIVLYYRLAEESLLYAIGLDYYIIKGTNKTTFQKRTNAFYSIPYGHRHLSNHFHEYLELVEERLDEPAISEMETKLLEKYSALFSDQRFKSFLELRHEGVSGHGFADFTKEQFERICEGSPLDLMDDILEEFDLIPPYSFFAALNEILQELIHNYHSEAGSDTK